MFRIIQGASVLLLLSVFFAYVLAPMVDGARRRARFGPRRRPMSRAAVMVALYVVIFALALLVWRGAGARIRHVVNVSAPAAIDRLFSGGEIDPLEAILRAIPDEIGRASCRERV